MPWSPEDAPKHHRGLSPRQRRQWAHVANQELQATGDEGRAIRAANAAVDRPPAFRQRRP